MAIPCAGSLCYVCFGEKRFMIQDNMEKEKGAMGFRLSDQQGLEALFFAAPAKKAFALLGIEETAEEHLTCQMNPSVLWPKQLMCLLKTKYIFPLEQIPEGLCFETSVCYLEGPHRDFGTSLPPRLCTHCALRLEYLFRDSHCLKPTEASRATSNATFSMISPVSPALIHHCIISEFFL